MAAMHFRGGQSNQGFSLIQVSMVMVIASVLMVSVLPGGKTVSHSEKRRITLERMQKIEDALQAFMLENQRLPCPADGSVRPENAAFGQELGSTVGPCSDISYGAPGKNPFLTPFITDRLSAGGVVPTKALKLPDEYMLDGWGRRVMYIVDLNAVQPDFCMSGQSDSSTITPGVEIRTSASATTSKSFALWALLSYGPDGHGAYPAVGGTSRLDASNTNADTIYNTFTATAGSGSGVGISGSLSTGNELGADGGGGNGVFNGILVQHSPSGSGMATFDDIVWVAPQSKNFCCLGKTCSMGFRYLGVSPDTALGSGSVVAGDFNCDSKTDFAVSPNVPGPAGSVTRILSGASVFNPMPPNTKTTNLTRTIINDMGVNKYGRSSAAGDIDGNGCDDLIVSSANRVFLMMAPGTGGTSNLSGLNLLGSPPPVGIAFIVDNGYVQHVGAGDINGDGYDDIIVMMDGMPDRGYVVYGTPTPTAWPLISTNPDTMDLRNLDQTYGFHITTSSDREKDFTSPYEYNNLAVADLNNDGYDDIVTGSDATNRGAWVLLGRSSANWNSLMTPVSGSGTGSGAGAGSGSGLADPGVAAGGSGASLDWSTLSPSGEGLWRYHSGGGVAAGTGSGSDPSDCPASSGSGDNLGCSYVGATDVNDDGIADLVLTDNGFMYVYYGRSGGWSDGDISTIADITVDHTAIWASTGYPLTRAADLNGDGRTDLIFSNSFTGNGTVYTAFQPSTGWPSTLTLNGALFNGTTGFSIPGAAAGDNFGWDIAVGDYNRDGINDLVASAPGVSAIGSVYVIYGRKNVPWSASEPASLW